MKLKYLCAKTLYELGLQSHHLGIETKGAKLVLKKIYFLQSHHLGIETGLQARPLPVEIRLQSHHLGIETLQRP